MPKLNFLEVSWRELDHAGFNDTKALKESPAYVRAKRDEAEGARLGALSRRVIETAMNAQENVIVMTRTAYDNLRRTQLDPELIDAIREVTDNTEAMSRAATIMKRVATERLILQGTEQQDQK
jgi:hypothetical protein